MQLQINLRCTNTKVGSLGTVGLCYQLQKRKCYNGRSPELLLKHECMEYYMLHVTYSSSPFSTFTVEVGPAHMLGWLADGPGDPGPRTEHPLCCRNVE